MGRDDQSRSKSGYLGHFNPRAPCGARRFNNKHYDQFILFQSTRPVWGATWLSTAVRSPMKFQSTRPVWGATADYLWFSGDGENFNPRAPCGARLYDLHLTVYLMEFQSTRPVWGATGGGLFHHECVPISIHAPRVGRDSALRETKEAFRDFNPRAPCGARRSTSDGSQSVRGLFQSTRPVWGATSVFLINSVLQFDFNPRAPCGARRVGQNQIHRAIGFQSTRPVWGATTRCTIFQQPAQFQSTRPVWGATITCAAVITNVIISIHAPRVGRDMGRRI